MELTPEILDQIKLLPSHKQLEIIQLADLLKKKRVVETAREKFIPFVKHCWRVTEAEEFTDTSYWDAIGRIFEDIIKGDKKRVIINIAPRVGKSRASSLFLPAMFLGKYPKHSIIQATHTADFSVEWGGKVRDVVDSKEFRELFPDVSLKADNKARGHWKTSQGGEYFAVGVGGRMVGRNADLLIIDDPHCLHVDTPIPTPNGFIAMGDIAIGDEVYDLDGKPVKVIGKSPVWERELWRAEVSDGSWLECDGQHLWTVRTDTKLSAPYWTKHTSELQGRTCYLPRHQPVEFPEANLPIDPWVLGAWLGDGTSSLGRMTAHPEDQPYMRSRFHAAGYETADHADKFSFGVLKLREQLRLVGVLNNKHIPGRYLTASPGQRLALLQGLMDTDGNVTKRGQCIFDNSNREIVDGVAELLRSLGVKAVIRIIFDHRYGEVRERYRIAFILKDAAGMPRKASRIVGTEARRSRSIRFNPTGKTGKVCCIKVDRPDGLFMAGKGYIVTHNTEQDGRMAAYKPEVFDRVYEWYLAGPRQRMMPNTRLILIMTRWGMRDLTGRILAHAKEIDMLDEWEVIQFPAINPDGTWIGHERFPLKYWLDVKAEYPASYWNSVYQQNPTSEEAALVKREWWKPWESNTPPHCEYVLQSWDTAYSAKERADYCACTTWGVFTTTNADGRKVPAIILLDTYRERLEFPDLKAKAKQLYNLKKPDTLLVEAKAAGAPLVAELRTMGIPVSEYTPTRGNDKIVRVNAISDLFKSGWVYFMSPPEGGKDLMENLAVIEEFAAFPTGEHDDLVDSSTQALLRFRQGGFIKTAMDYDYEEEDDQLIGRPVKFY